MIIETKKLTKKFKDKVAVDNLDLKINEGELFALLGVNGAGKTTTIRMLTGLLNKTSGDIIIDGKDYENNLSDIKNIINISPQETAIAPNLTVIENFEFLAGVYKIKDKDRIDELIDLFKLNDIKKQKAGTLSGGYKRRLSIALSLINSPKILFLDEPTLGLDVIARRELWKIIENLKAKTTIILTTHYMEEAESLADSVGIMVNGKLLCVGSVFEIVEKNKCKNLEAAFIKVAQEVK